MHLAGLQYRRGKTRALLVIQQHVPGRRIGEAAVFECSRGCRGECGKAAKAQQQHARQQAARQDPEQQPQDAAAKAAGIVVQAIINLVLGVHGMSSSIVTGTLSRTVVAGRRTDCGFVAANYGELWQPLVMRR